MLSMALCAALAGCGPCPDTTQTLDELGYGPTGRDAILRQAIDTNDQTYVYTAAGDLLPIRLALQTEPSLSAQIGAIEYEPLAYLLRRALTTDYTRLAACPDPAAAPGTGGPDPNRIFNLTEADRGRKVVRTYGVIGNIGYLRPDDVAVQGAPGIALSRRFGLDLHSYFIIYGIAVNLDGEFFAFYMPVSVRNHQFDTVYTDLVEKQHSFTVVDFAGWYYKHQAWVSTHPAMAKHFWMLPTLVGPVPQYTAGNRYTLGPQEEEQIKQIAERPLAPEGGMQVYHRAMFDFVSTPSHGMLRHDGQLLLTDDQIYNALIADSLINTPDGKAPDLHDLTVVVTVDRGDWDRWVNPPADAGGASGSSDAAGADAGKQGAPPKLGELKDLLDILAAHKVGAIFVKLLSQPGPADVNLEALRRQFLAQRAAELAAHPH
ncbi:MAG: hypothetical protein ACREJ2_18890 [Planctomycetota bacterium]